MKLDAFFDAQTSGGLLISVPMAKVGRLVEELKANGALAASIIGEVIAKREASLLLTA